MIVLFVTLNNKPTTVSLM